MLAFSFCFWGVAQKSGRAGVMDNVRHSQDQCSHLAQGDAKSAWDLLCVRSSYFACCKLHLPTFHTWSPGYEMRTSDFRMASLWWHGTDWFYSPSESGTLRFVLASELGVNGFHISFQSLPSFTLQALRNTMLLLFSSTVVIPYVVWILGKDSTAAGCISRAIGLLLVF